jgi:hypothetical protein
MVATFERRGAVMKVSKKVSKGDVKKRLRKKFRAIIRREYERLISERDDFFIEDLFDEIFNFIVEETSLLEKLKTLDFDIDLIKRTEIEAVFGEEQYRQWKNVGLAKLEENFEKAAAKLQRKDSEKKKNSFYQKVMSRQGKLMNHCLLMGAEWEEIQDILDETINDVL